MLERRNSSQQQMICRDATTLQLVAYLHMISMEPTIAKWSCLSTTLLEALQNSNLESLPTATYPCVHCSLHVIYYVQCRTIYIVVCCCRHRRQHHYCIISLSRVDCYIDDMTCSDDHAICC
jgi:hypothetical protein